MVMRKTLDQRLEERGISRREFMKFAGTITTVMGLSPYTLPQVAEVMASPMARPSVVWLHFAECTGCTESFLRSTYPWIREILLEVISLDYHETLMAAAGKQAEEILKTTLEENKGKFICIVEGGIPTKDQGVYGRIGGRTMLEIAKEVCSDALATICVGNCACFGGIQAATPNPTGTKSVSEATGIQTINISGCPPNTVNMVATVVYYLLFNKLPEVDEYGRPLFAFGKTIHEQCPRRAHYDAEEFVVKFGDEGHRKGWCLYQVGCKGPVTYNNCPIAKFNDGISWPVQAGHPCVGCSEPGFWDDMTPFYGEETMSV
jgi:[NiFe] hydrogenase small subunit